jgi:hypothetical protein
MAIPVIIIIIIIMPFFLDTRPIFKELHSRGFEVHSECLELDTAVVLGREVTRFAVV